MYVLTYKGEEGDKLALLKSRLMELFAPSDSEPYHRMCSVPMLQPGQKPSALYANLRALQLHDVEPDVDSTYLFRMMFLTRLPKNIQSLVQAQGKKPISEMAAFANYVVLNEGKPSLPVQAASFNWAEEVEGQEQLAAQDNTTVGQAVNVVKQSRKALKKSSGMCFYQSKFGSKAEKCEGKGISHHHSSLRSRETNFWECCGRHHLRFQREECTALQQSNAERRPDRCTIPRGYLGSCQRVSKDEAATLTAVVYAAAQQL